MNHVMLMALTVAAVFQLGFIKPTEVKRAAPISAERWVDLSKADVGKKVGSIKDPLAKASAYFFLNQFEECAGAAKAVGTKSIVFDYSLKLTLVCARKALELKNNVVAAAETLKFLLKNEKLMPASGLDSLREFQINVCQALAKKSQWKLLRVELQKFFDQELSFTKSQRAIGFALAGDLMVYDRKWIEALNYFARSKDLDPEAVMESKVKNILSLVPQTFRDKFEKVQPKAPANGVEAAIPSTEEAELANQANSYIAKGDVVGATEAMANLLKKFPQSIKSKWAQDKIYELLSVEVEKSRGPEGNSVAKNKIVKIMGELDFERMSTWASSLFNSQSYADAAFLFEKAFELTEGTSTGAKNLYMAARSYQLAQQYSQAKNLYKIFTSKYASSAEFVDAAMQWAFVNYNEGDYSEAITHFEMARSRKLTFQQDLVSLFWLFQAYKTKGETSLKLKTATTLVERFPLTYYGLIAYNEINQKLPQFEKAKAKNLKLNLSQAESKALERAKVLMKAGLLDEASEEIALIQNRPLSQDENLFLSENYSKVLNYPKAFNLLSTVFDEDQSMRDDALLKTFFPKEFWSHVSDDKKRFQVDPYLLLAVMRQESAFRVQAVSRSGALGLLQMIPPTAEEVKTELGAKIEIPQDMFDPGINIRFCAYYLAKLIKKYDGSIPLALAAYNAGPTRISQFIKAQKDQVRDTWVDELPISETSFYVKSILKNYILYRVLYSGQTSLGTPPWSIP